jgi:phosphoglycolate phosphatase
MKKYSHIIWDWNGTLLDDVDWCIKSINVMLKKRGIPLIDSVDSYREIFGFPVKEYYLRAGFDFAREPFEKLAAEYITLYHGADSEIALFPGTEEILAGFRQNGVRQIVLSASNADNLIAQIRPFNLDTYFDEILGISDVYAASKLDIGRAYIERTNPDNAVLIGDTSHDKEVADALGIDCILVADGHQSKETLLAFSTAVADNLENLKNYMEMMI